MHRVTTKIGVFIVVLLIVTTGVSSSQTTQTEKWDKFSSGIKMALKGTNPGVKQSAILLVIKHGNKLHIDEAIPDLIRYYHSRQDEFSQKLALLAIFQVDSNVASELMYDQLVQQTTTAKQEILKMYSR